MAALQGWEPDSHSESLEWLRERGFKVNDDISILHGVDEVAERCRWWEDRRDALDFEIDGVVVKVDDRGLQRELGVAGREPRWAVAWKFPPTTATTKLNKIVWNVGRTGHLLPFAMLEPVHVSGVTVSTATLHNEEDLERKDVREGDEVVVMRAGDVIPQVVSPIIQRRKKGTRKPKPPKKCPLCGTPTVKPEDGVFTICPNRTGCPGQQFQHVKHFRGALEIEGLGEKNAVRFLQEGLISDAADIFDLTAERIAELEGFGQISAENLIEEIEDAKKMPFSRVLYALGIPGIGFVNAESLAEHFGTMDALLEAQPEQIEQAEGIGPDPGRADLRGALRGADEEADRAAAQGRPADGARPVRAPQAGRPARRQDAGADRHAAEPEPRAGDPPDPPGRRQGRQLGLEEDRLRDRRRQPGLEARQGRGARHRGDRRGGPAEARRRGWGSQEAQLASARPRLSVDPGDEMTDATWLFIQACWIVWLVVWVAMSFGTKRTVERGGSRRIPPCGRRSSILGAALPPGGCLRRLVAFYSSGIRLLGARDRRPTASSVAGFAVLLCWARIVLGRNWSAEVTFKQGHELIQSGPYALARHPIYTGLIVMALGTALNYGRAFRLRPPGGALRRTLVEGTAMRSGVMSSPLPGRLRRSTRRAFSAIIPSSVGL